MTDENDEILDVLEQLEKCFDSRSKKESHTNHFELIRLVASYLIEQDADRLLKGEARF